MEVEIDDAALISIDSKGTDIRVRQGAQVRDAKLKHLASCCCFCFVICYCDG